MGRFNNTYLGIGFSSSVDFSSEISKKSGKAIDGLLKKLNRKTPGILKRAIKDTLNSNGMGGYANFIDSFKSELRMAGSSHAGSGILFRVVDDSLFIRIDILKGKGKKLEAVFGKDGYWEFIRNTFGFPGAVVFAEANETNTLAIRREEDHPAAKPGKPYEGREYDNNVNPGKEGELGTGVQFVKGPLYIPPSEAKTNWLEEAQDLAVKRAMQFFRTL